MFFRTFIIIPILISLSQFCMAAEKLIVEESPLTKEEIKMFKRIIKYDKDFHYSKKAKRYFIVEPGTKTKLPVLVELVFDRKGDQLLFEEYIGYGVSFEPDSLVVRYSFDGGTGNR